MALLRRLLRPFLNPIVEKELRSRMRTGRASLLISFYLLTLAGVGWFTYIIVRRQASGGVSNGQVSVHVGTTIFRALTVWELVLVLFIAPALTAAAIAGEKERQTLDLLLCTRVRPASIVIGKLVASLLFSLLLLLASVPVFSVVFLFGGVELRQVIGVAGILGLTAVVIGSIGLLCSTLMRRPTGATVVAYIIAFLYLIVPLGTSIIFPTSVASRTVQAYAEIANPGFALGSTLLDTPIRSPINAPIPPQSQAQPSVPNSGIGGTSCTVTSTGSFCTSVGSSSAPLTLQPNPPPIPQNDKVQAGIFRGFRAWQAFGTLSMVLVAVVVAMSVAILQERPVHLPGRRRRRKARTSPRHVRSVEEAVAPPGEEAGAPGLPEPVMTETTAHE
jgi:ABC-type transport system involved in multi-copper enzyme maturation permease subunit